jgi:hypothetical protein
VAALSSCPLSTLQFPYLPLRLLHKIPVCQEGGNLAEEHRECRQGDVFYRVLRIGAAPQIGERVD